MVEEALAHGVPVVVSSRGALPERAAGKGGIVVRSGGIMPLRINLLKLVRSRSALDALKGAIPAQFPGLEVAASRYRSLLQESLSMAD